MNNYNEETLFMKNGMITFDDMEVESSPKRLIQDYFDVYVGLVTGKEEIYKNNDVGNIEVLNGENKTDKYIYIDKYPSTNEKINNCICSGAR